MNMAQDIPPFDETVLDVIRSSGGITPSALLEALENSDHTRNDVINSIQRVFSRGKIVLADGGRLVVAPERVKAAA